MDDVPYDKVVFMIDDWLTNHIFKRRLMSTLRRLYVDEMWKDSHKL